MNTRIQSMMLLTLMTCAGSFATFASNNDTTFVASGNPIVNYKYLGDPAAMVYDGKVYIYAGHDECPCSRTILPDERMVHSFYRRYAYFYRTCLYIKSYRF